MPCQLMQHISELMITLITIIQLDLCRFQQQLAIFTAVTISAHILSFTSTGNKHPIELMAEHIREAVPFNFILSEISSTTRSLYAILASEVISDKT